MKLNDIIASLFLFLFFLVPNGAQGQAEKQPERVERARLEPMIMKCANPSFETAPLKVLFDMDRDMLRLMRASGMNCIGGKELKSQYEEICGCLSPSIKESMRRSGVEKFNKTLSSAILKNGITYASTIPKKPSTKKKVDKNKAQEAVVESVDALFKIKNSEFNKTKDDLIEKVNEFKECGFSIDEFRRFTRIPSGDFVAAMNANPVDPVVIENQWKKYLKINPELTAINSGLKESKDRDAFKNEFIGKFQSMFKAAPEATSVYNGEAGTSDMWKQIDDQFGKEGAIRGIINSYQDNSQKIQEEGISRAKKMYSGDERGFSANINTILENPSVWDAYFGGDESASTNCNVAQASRRKMVLNKSDICLSNVMGFCGVYESSKEPGNKRSHASEKWDFTPMLLVEQSYDESMKLFKEQGTLLCKTPLKTYELVDKKGRKVEEEMNFQQFKERLCDKKDLDLKAKDIKDVDKLCDPKTQDNFRLLGVFHKFIPRESRLSAMGITEKINPNPENVKVTGEIVTFIRLRSLSDPLYHEGNDESNIISALSGHTGKDGLAIYQKTSANDDEHYKMVTQTYAQINKDGTSVSATIIPSVVTEVGGVPNQDKNVVQPVQNTPVSSGFAPAGEMKMNVPTSFAKNEVLNTESKNIAQISEKITKLVEEKRENISVPDREVKNSKIDDEIADLRKQLAASEARYKKSLAELSASSVKENPVKSNDGTASTVQNNPGTFAANANNYNNVASGQISNGGNVAYNNGNNPGVARLTGGSGSSNAALNSGGTNNALLLANNVNTKDRSSASYNESSSLFKIIRAEDKNEIGLVSDKAVFTKFIAKDKSLFEKYASEMKDKNIKVLLVQNEGNNQVLRYTLIGNKLEEEGQVTAREQKYFSRNLKNLIKSETLTTP